MLTTSFWVRACAQPGALARVLAHVEQRGLVPSEVSARVEHDMLEVRIVQPGMDLHCAEIVAEKMRSMVMVERVSLRVVGEAREAA